MVEFVIKTLLIVEDSELIRKVTRLAFPASEHDLYDAEDGERETSQLLINARKLNPAAVVKKPWKPQELAALVRGIVERPGKGKE